MGKTITGTHTLSVTLTASPTTVEGTIATTTAEAVYGPPATAWKLTNKGTILSSFSTAIGLAGGGTIANSGLIEGQYLAILIEKSARITNTGAIIGRAADGDGIILDQGGTLTNGTAGVIAADFAIASFGTTSILNQGLIDATGSYGEAIQITAGVIDNAAGATIAGGNGIALTGPGTLIDAGLIASTHTGGFAIALGQSPGDTIILEKTGTIAGAIENFGGGDTIDEAGLTLTSESYAGGILTLYDGTAIAGALQFFGNLNTSAFTLTSDGAGGTDIALGTERLSGTYTTSLYLAATSDIVTKTGLIDAPDQAIIGTAARDWTLVNDGTITGGESGVSLFGTAHVTNAEGALIQGATGLSLGAGTLTESGTIIGTQGPAIYLIPGAAAADIILKSGYHLQGGIAGFETGDTIALPNIKATTETFANGTLTLTNAGATVASLALDGLFNTAGLILGTAAAGGALITAAPRETFTGQYSNTALTLTSLYTSLAKSAVITNLDDAVIGKTGHAWTLVNAGTVAGNYAGVEMESGRLTNAATGLIEGGSSFTDGAAGIYGHSLVNAGTVIGIGSYSYGFKQYTEGNSRNLATGTIAGAAAGVFISGGSFANAGLVTGALGVNLYAGASLTNTGRLIGTGGNIYQTYRDAGALIYGTVTNAAGATMAGSDGARLYAGTLTNAGRIEGLPGGYREGPSGGKYSVASTGLLITNTAAATNAGIISGATAVALDGGTLTDAGTIASTAAAGIAIAFGTADATLFLDHGNVITGAISGFQGGDIIDFAATTITADTFTNGIITLLDGAAIVEKLSLTGALTQTDFTLVSEGARGTELILGQTAAGAAGTGAAMRFLRPGAWVASPRPDPMLTLPAAPDAPPAPAASPRLTGWLTLDAAPRPLIPAITLHAG